MQYSEIRIRVRTQDVDTAGAIAGLVVPYGFYIEDYSDIEELHHLQPGPRPFPAVWAAVSYGEAGIPSARL